MKLDEHETTPAENAIIEKYNLKCWTKGGHFFVSNPKHKKLGSMSGGHLYLLLTDMAKATDRLEEARPKKSVIKGEMKTSTVNPEDEVEAQRRFEAGLPMPVAPTPETYSGEATEQETPEPVVEEPESKQAVPKPPQKKTKKTSKPKRTQENMKFLQIMLAYLRHPNATPEEIIKIVAEKGIVGKESSVKMLKHMLSTAQQAIKIFEGEK